MNKNIEESFMQLKKSNYKKGMLTFDDIICVGEKFNLDFSEIDLLSEKLLDYGMIIEDSDNTNIIENKNKNDINLNFEINHSSARYKEIFKAVLKKDIGLKEHIKYVERVMPSRKNEINNLVVKARENNEYAKIRIINMYSKSVIRIASYFSEKYNFPISDAIQEGYIGLMKAIEKYDLKNTTPFISFASWHMRGQIQRKAFFQDSILYYPVHIKENLFSIYELFSEHDYFTRFDPQLYVNLVMERIKCDEIKAMWYINQYSRIEPIDDYIIQESFLISDNYECEEMILLNIEEFLMKKEIENLLLKLSDAERKIIFYRFGFNEKSPKTLEEIGNIIGVTRERVRQIEKKALEKIKKYIIKNNYFGFIKDKIV